MNKIEIYDTTLRDGTQGLDFNLTAEDKVAIAKRLDEFRVDFIEGGWPGSNPKDMQFFIAMQTVELKYAKLAAFGSTRHKDNKPEQDPNLQKLIEANTPVVTIFGKSWDLHVTLALNTSLAENLHMIEDSIAYLKSQNKMVIYDAEHFFDGYRANSDYTLKTLEAALSGGADRIVLCDTNGGSLPEFITKQVTEIVSKYSKTNSVLVGVHMHNDCELGVANSLAGISAGAKHVQGTINGYGERCGNANLVSIIPNIALKLGFEQPQELTKLREVSRYIDERANLHPNVRAAFVGDAAFAHKGGVHVSAVNKKSETYEHIFPEQVGNQRRILLSDLSGRANILAKVEKHEDVDKKDPAVKDVLERMKELENRGYAFEGAEASFRLMSSKVKGDYQPYFILHGFNINLTKRDSDPVPVVEATVKVETPDGNLVHTAASGNGPVNALDQALRKALVDFFPELNDLELTDYKVRVLSGVESGTGSVVRVLVETTDGKDIWGTVGASSDIINASYEALIDAIEYKLLKDKVKSKHV